MTYEEFYGNDYSKLQQAEAMLNDLLSKFQENENEKKIAYVSSRIKSPDSMQKKLVKKGEQPTGKNALLKVNDAVGVRVICSFIDDIYKVSDWISKQEMIEVINIKDYIAYPKENGYRSFHMIIKLKDLNLNAEIQIRTIALDFWANLEHQMKYKRDIKNEEMIRSELKRCADEIASVDLSMQTIKDLIFMN
jgi:putative GTP pyrophosphokinase